MEGEDARLDVIARKALDDILRHKLGEQFRPESPQHIYQNQGQRKSENAKQIELEEVRKEARFVFGTNKVAVVELHDNARQTRRHLVAHGILQDKQTIKDIYIHNNKKEQNYQGGREIPRPR